jgi:DNA polymerase-3 subunit beta
MSTEPKPSTVTENPKPAEPEAPPEKLNTAVQSKDLAAATQIAARVVGNSSIPILNNCLIGCSHSTMAIVTTDLDQWVTVIIPAVSGDPGNCTVPVRRLNEIARGCTNGVAMELTEKKVLRILNGADFSLFTLPAEEFPCEMEFKETPKVFSLRSDHLRMALQRVALAMSADSTRYVLNGILLELSKNAVTLVATDGRRLHLQTIVCDWPHPVPAKGKGKNRIETPVSVLIMRDTVEFLLATLPKKGIQPVEIQFETDRVRFLFTAGPGVQITAKTIDGTFPNWRMVVPSDFKTFITFNREQLLDALRTMEKATTDKDRSVRIGFGKETRMCAGPVDNTASVTLAGQIESGEPLTASYQPNYLAETISALSAERVRFSLTDEVTPCLVTEVGSPDYFAVVMPMRMS